MEPCYECKNWNHVDCVTRKPHSKKKCNCWCTKKGKYLKPKLPKSNNLIEITNGVTGNMIGKTGIISKNSIFICEIPELVRQGKIDPKQFEGLLKAMSGKTFKKSMKEFLKKYDTVIPSHVKVRMTKLEKEI